MGDEVRLIGAMVIAFAMTLVLTPLAGRLAVTISMFDRPVGYKQHSRATPYLGGLAVMTGFLVASGVFGTNLSDYGTFLAGTLALLAVGTLDDRFGLPITPRLLAQVGAGLLLWFHGIQWNMFPGDAADFLLTVFWTVGLINAFNLMDNLDGAAGTVGSVCAASTGVLALLRHDVSLGILTLSLCGACAGFLPSNLARPSRIFLGDGGSMPLGFLVAGMVMAVPSGQLHWATLLTIAPLAGLPILDTTLVVVSRLHRGAPVLQGGRDHLTHRLLDALHTPRRVALVLALAQALFSTAAIVTAEFGGVGTAVPLALVYLGVGAGIIAVLEFSPWAVHPPPEEQSA